METGISAAQAANIYKAITGHTISPGQLIQYVNQKFTHLGYYCSESADRTLLGIREARFKYFVQSRLLCHGRLYIFTAETEDDNYKFTI